jgi:hypothetical protein
LPFGFCVPWHSRQWFAKNGRTNSWNRRSSGGSAGPAPTITLATSPAIKKLAVDGDLNRIQLALY